jgi:hypothetical protein
MQDIKQIDPKEGRGDSEGEPVRRAAAGSWILLAGIGLCAFWKKPYQSEFPF